MKSLLLLAPLLAFLTPVSAGESTKVTKPEERGTIEHRTEKVRGDSGKWRDEARLQVSPAPDLSASNGSLDDWADTLDLEKIVLTSGKDTWLIYRTEQLDDNDRVWVDSIEWSDDGKRITITFSRATWLGYYSKNFTWYNVTGVNLGKLKPGDYDITWIEKPLEFTEFEDPKDRRNSRSTGEKPAEGAEPTILPLSVSVGGN